MLEGGIVLGGVTCKTESVSPARPTIQKLVNRTGRGPVSDIPLRRVSRTALKVLAKKRDSIRPGGAHTSRERGEGGVCLGR